MIDSRCNGDQRLVAEVWSLLDACEEEERLTASRRLEPGAGRESQAEARQIGPYVLDRLLGRGGMGAVYLAHRADGQFEQKVAIKLIDLPLATERLPGEISPGTADSCRIAASLYCPPAGWRRDRRRRFVSGDGVCGWSSHPSLLRGAAPLRRANACDLFLRVCEAVQFAHQNFVVHRDLKPDNILVAEDGTPRLLDFGTAKLLSPSTAAPGSELTREGYQSFTPQYASPEQVLGNPITTASDTYSLGVLLYLLLTGNLPYEFKELTTGEMLRVICEEPPRRPSLEVVIQASGSMPILERYC